MSSTLSSQQHSSTQMQTDYSAATLNGTTLNHCLAGRKSLKYYRLNNPLSEKMHFLFNCMKSASHACLLISPNEVGRHTGR